MHFSYWVSFLILAARARAMASPRLLDGRALDDSCMTYNDCPSTDGFDYTCIHPGHSAYGYCQFKDCRSFGCGNHGLDPCLSDGAGRPWKCGSYADVYASSVAAASASMAAAESSPAPAPAPAPAQSSALEDSKPSATAPSQAAAEPEPIKGSPSAATVAPAKASSATQNVPAAAAESQAPDEAQVTSSSDGLYTIQTSPPEAPTQGASSPASSSAPSGNRAGSSQPEVVVPGASAASSAASAASGASDVADGSASVSAGAPSASLSASGASFAGVLPPTTLRSVAAASSSAGSGSAIAPSRTTLGASGIPTGAALSDKASNGLWLVLAGVVGALVF